MSEVRKRSPIVLVADDDAASRRAMRLILLEDGYEVVEYEDGAEALCSLAKATDDARPLPAALVLDFCMPGLSGIGLVQVLRRFARIPPTILVTGFPDASVELFAHRVGVARVLRKPVDADELRGAITDATDGGLP